MKVTKKRLYEIINEELDKAMKKEPEEVSVEEGKEEVVEEKKPVEEGCSSSAAAKDKKDNGDIRENVNKLKEALQNVLNVISENFKK